MIPQEAVFLSDKAPRTMTKESNKEMSSSQRRGHGREAVPQGARL